MAKKKYTHRSDLEKRVGQRVREFRKNVGWTQEELGHRCGVTTEFVNKVENNKSGISLNTLDELLAAMDLEVAEFFNFRNVPKKASQPKSSVYNKIDRILRQCNDVDLKRVLRLLELATAPKKPK